MQVLLLHENAVLYFVILYINVAVKEKKAVVSFTFWCITKESSSFENITSINILLPIDTFHKLSLFDLNGLMQSIYMHFFKT